jgi:hypothetical protein
VKNKRKVSFNEENNTVHVYAKNLKQELKYYQLEQKKIKLVKRLKVEILKAKRNKDNSRMSYLLKLKRRYVDKSEGCLAS